MVKKSLTLDIFFEKGAEVEKPIQKREFQKPYKLPRGWKWVKLGSIARISAGGTPKRSIKEYWNGNIPWVKISDIPEHGLVLDTEEKITEEGLKNSSAKIFPKGTILFSIFATIAKVGILGIDAATNQAIAGIQIKNTQIVDRKYLFYCLKNFGLTLAKIGRGMAQRNINQTILRNLEIPLPPLEEQKRIVARIEELVSRVEEARRLRKLAREETEKIMQAALHKVFSRAEEKGWKWVKLRDVLKEDRQTINPQNYPDREFFLITMDCIESDTGRLLKIVKCRGKEIGSTKYVFNTKHILYGKLRPYLNKVYVPDREGICTTEFIPFAVVNALREYVAFYLRRKEVVNFAMRHITGTRQPRVIIDEFLEYPIPLPTLEEQKHIVAHLDKVSKTIESLRKLQQITDKELEKLVPAILDKAFKGEL
ncbi:MAG: hypothetical protein DRJ59_00805 [Thermoprotei archaeon]|nr:MAG: hypothetical protein DRJ59_00805 [Thermoprotei archaeon]